MVIVGIVARMIESACVAKEAEYGSDTVGGNRCLLVPVSVCPHTASSLSLFNLKPEENVPLQLEKDMNEVVLQLLNTQVIWVLHRTLNTLRFESQDSIGLMAGVHRLCVPHLFIR